MARSNESFNRRERERAKKQKANDKRQRRLAKPETDEAAEEPAAPAVDQGVLLQQLADLNAAFDAGDIKFEDFEEQRDALLEAIRID